MSQLFGTYAPENLDAFSVRELNFARARLGVLAAFFELLAQASFTDISVREICRHSEISEPSFYNYFPRKDDLFLYFISIWSVDVQLHCLETAAGLATIREIFRYTAAGCSSFPELMKEVIAYQAKTDPASRISEITPVTIAEKSIVFGNVTGLAGFPDQGLGPLLFRELEAAAQQGEIAPGDTEGLALLLGSIFFGIPVIMLHRDSANLAKYYETVLGQILPLNTKPKKVKRRRNK